MTFTLTSGEGGPIVLEESQVELLQEACHKMQLNLTKDIIDSAVYCGRHDTSGVTKKKIKRDQFRKLYSMLIRFTHSTSRCGYIKEDSCD